MVIFCLIQDILLGESRGFLHVEGNNLFGVAPIDENPFQVFLRARATMSSLVMIILYLRVWE